MGVNGQFLAAPRAVAGGFQQGGMLNATDGDGLIAEGLSNGIIGLGAAGCKDDFFGAGVDEGGHGSTGVFQGNGGGVTGSVESGGVAEIGVHGGNHSAASDGQQGCSGGEVKINRGGVRGLIGEEGGAGAGG